MLIFSSDVARGRIWVFTPHKKIFPLVNILFIYEICTKICLIYTSTPHAYYIILATPFVVIKLSETFNLLFYNIINTNILYYWCEKIKWHVYDQYSILTVYWLILLKLLKKTLIIEKNVLTIALDIIIMNIKLFV